MASLAEVLALAFRYHQTGQLQAAEQVYRQVLDGDPNQPDALHYLGLAAHQGGMPERAIEYMRRSIELQPENAHFHSNLGNVLTDQGRLDEAVACYQKSLEISPDDAEAHGNLGAALKKRGQLESAIANYQRAVQLKPDHAEAHHNLGNAYQTQGKFTDAESSYQRALAIRPDYYQVQIRLGDLHRECGRASEAIAAYQRALQSAWQQRETDGAKSICHEILRLDPNNAAAMRLLGHIALDKRKPRDAITLYEKAIAIEPNVPQAHHSLGSAYRFMGDFKKSEMHYKKALALKPDYSDVLLNLTVVRRFNRDDPELALIEQQLLRPSLSNEDRFCLHFAAGKIYDDIGDFDTAFSHYRQGNFAKHAEFDCDTYIRYVSDLIANVDRDMVKRASEFGRHDELPVFVVGMPRSGTTLVEQILSSHSDVFGAGELRDIKTLARRLPSHNAENLPYTHCLGSIEPATVTEFADEYLNRIRALGGNAKRVVDKAPLNHQHLGLIAMLLPASRVVHCRRDPFDTCLSCYFQPFTDQKFSYSLTHIGLFYRLYRRLMDHWREILTIPTFELQYEDLVADQERISKQLIEFCGLQWDERCLRFNETDRPVVTASDWQVRRKIYQTSTKRWQNYEKHLGPLREALGMS